MVTSIHQSYFKANACLGFPFKLSVALETMEDEISGVAQPFCSHWCLQTALIHHLVLSLCGIDIFLLIPSDD